MGPLDGLRVVELAAIGPVPYAGMLLADLGANVVRVDRVGGDRPAEPHRILDRGRRSVALDLKHPRAVEAVLRLAEGSDVLIEGYRPGVAERLGLGPAECLRRNPALVYGRMTGWGRDGPLASTAGHDINYLALSGILDAIGPVGGVEEPFYRALLAGLGLDPAGVPDRYDRTRWPDLRAALGARFAEKGRDEWLAVFAGTDACVTPVLTLAQAPDDPHQRARATYRDGEPAPAPRFSRTPGATQGPAPVPGEHTREVLAECGLSPAEIDEVVNSRR